MTWRTPSAVVLAIAIVVGAAALRARSSEDRESILSSQVIAAVPEPATPRQPPAGCLPTGDGFFRARLDGALQMRLDWSNAQITCEGMPRPGGDGIRLSFKLEPQGASPFLIVLGIAGLSESSSGKALPANVTIIEGEKPSIYGTLGDDKCTIDELRQELVEPWRADARLYRVSGRGFCIEPALAVGGERRVLMSTFDFAGQVMYETLQRPAEGSV